MYWRVVFPIYNESHEYVIGCTGRSVFEKCKKCGSHHWDGKECPKPEWFKYYAKWRNNENFDKESSLFNLWFASQHIEETRNLILVEGPLDVLFLEQFGIHNSLAMYGLTLSEQQQILIERSGATRITLLMDEDIPGQSAIPDLYKKFCRSYKVYVPEYKTGQSLKSMGEKELKTFLKI